MQRLLGPIRGQGSGQVVQLSQSQASHWLLTWDWDPPQPTVKIIQLDEKQKI